MAEIPDQEGQKPSIGRAVHYDTGNTECHAATIARVIDDETVNLGNILAESGGPLTIVGQIGDPVMIGHATLVPLHHGPRGRTGIPTWHWPERV